MSTTLEYNNKSLILTMLTAGFTTATGAGRHIPPTIAVYASALTLIEAETGYSVLESLECIKDIVTGNEQLETGFQQFLDSRKVKPAESAASFAAAFSDFTL